MGTLGTNQDLFEGIVEICRQEEVHLGRIEAIGAVRKARIGYYDQHKQQYVFHEIDQPMEIAKLSGNVSMRDGDPILHAHITLADAEGHAFGGHLAPGTTVFACEFILEIYEGPRYAREYDAATGLPLWKLEQ
jgi:predicted DNA-binding protein with PD1-like motif